MRTTRDNRTLKIRNELRSEPREQRDDKDINLSNTKDTEELRILKEYLRSNI